MLAGSGPLNGNMGTVLQVYPALCCASSAGFPVSPLGSSSHWWEEWLILFPYDSAACSIWHCSSRSNLQGGQSLQPR